MARQGSDVPMQLRLAFALPTRPVSVVMSLNGLTVLVECDPSSGDEVFAYLASAGLDPQVTEMGDLSFSVRKLPHLRDLPPQVSISHDPALAPLALLARHPSSEDLPAKLSCESHGSLTLSWYDGRLEHECPFHTSAAAALLSAELPFIATPDAWEILQQVCQLPVLAGRARVNLDRFIEITTTKPQMVETAPLPGLFKLDDTRFGLALPYAESIVKESGFQWEGRPPTIERAPDPLPLPPVPLSAHTLGDLHTLVSALAAYRAQAVIWESGLGRRIFALAAINALDAWPLTIVTPPSAVWVWQRHLDMFGRSHSLSHERADAHILTYHDLVHRRVVPAPQAIILDELTSEEASLPEVRAALRRFDSVQDMYRIATSAAWPEDLSEAVEVMSVLRPVEFPTSLSLFQRYPVSPEIRASEHLSAYMSVRRHSDPGLDPTPFRRSSVLVVNPSEAQNRALDELSERAASSSPQAVLAEALEVVSAGPTHAVGPKIAAVAARVRISAEAGRRVAVCTRHRRTATLIRATLRGLTVATLDAAEPSGAAGADTQVVIVRFDRTLPDLRSLDEVIIVDYPWSAEVIEHSVGAAGDERGPSEVLCVHSPGTIDDRLAMLAARRRELGAVLEATALPNPRELAYLLTPR